MKIYKTILLQLLALFLLSGCNIEPEYFSELEPSMVYDSPQRVYERLASVYIHVAYNEGIGFHNSSWSFLQEFNTDEICLPARGGHWSPGEGYIQHYDHAYSPEMINAAANGAWGAVGQGVSKAYQAKADLEKYVDFETMFPGKGQTVKNDVLTQLDVIVAMCYLRGLDFFGGYPIYYSNQEPLKGRNTDVEVFNFVESLLLNALSKLPVRGKLNAIQTGYVDRGVAAALLARLYFNAKSYIGEERWVECIKICENFRLGEYGTYKMADKFQDVFGWGNETCSEIIWSIPSDYTKTNHWNFGNYEHTLHYQSWKTLKFTGLAQLFGNKGLYNGWSLTPSITGDGKCYLEGRPDLYVTNQLPETTDPGKTNKVGYGKEPTPFKLGCPYAKFSDGDVRKQQYVYEGNGKYKGMFLIGPQGYEIEGKIEGAAGENEYLGKPLVFVDQMAYLNCFNPTKDELKALEDELKALEDAKKAWENAANEKDEEKKTKYEKDAKNAEDKAKNAEDKAKDEKEKRLQKYQEGVKYAEENSGVRLIKFGPISNAAEASWMFNPDRPIIRLAEIEYMLAECKMRQGDTGGAAAIINDVRKRYFEGENDPNPVSAANLDKYRMLDEWMIEFLGENRRRTDLIRWGEFTNGRWFDHEPDNGRYGDGKYLNRLPLGASILDANPMLKGQQNPGYAN